MDMSSKYSTGAKNMVMGGINPSIKSIFLPTRRGRNNQYIYLTDLFLSVGTKIDKSNTHLILPWMKSKLRGS